MARDGKSFQRKPPRLKPQPRTLILCEDSKSSLKYLTDAARELRAHAQVEIAHCGYTDPKGIVTEAIKRKREFDIVYCVIDRDTHAGFDEAITTALAYGITVIASYPCYEFWLLLHFKKSRAPYVGVGAVSAAQRVIRELRKQPDMAEYDKALDAPLFARLRDRLPTAEHHASVTLAQAVADGEMNPSTRLHLLISALAILGKPQTID